MKWEAFQHLWGKRVREKGGGDRTCLTLEEEVWSVKGGWSHLALEEVCIEGLDGAHEDLRPDVGVTLGQPGGRCGWVV